MNIDSEIILQRKISSLVYVYIMIIIVITLSLIILITVTNYKTYYKVQGTVIEENNHYQIKVFVPIEDISYFIKNNLIIIENKTYRYQISSVSEEYYTDNIKTYEIIMLEIPLEDKYHINNLTIDLQVLKENKRVIDYLLKR